MVRVIDVTGDKQMQCPRDKNVAYINHNSHGCEYLVRPNQNIGGPRSLVGACRRNSRERRSGGTVRESVIGRDEG